MSTILWPDQHVNVITESTPTTFYSYPKLPLELRREIWLQYLGSRRRQIYRFNLRYPRRRTNPNYRNIPLPGDELILEPHGNWSGSNYPTENVLELLKASTSTIRFAAATCVESRQTVYELYPNVLRFRVLPDKWCLTRKRVDRPDGRDYPEYALRFNGADDIFVFYAHHDDQEAATNIIKLKGSPPDEFTAMRHVGLSPGSFQWHRRFMRTVGSRLEDCRCETEECQDSCKMEPTPNFLACFPNLECFYVADIRERNLCCDEDSVLDTGPDEPGADTPCPCPRPEDCCEEPRHSWPTVSIADVPGRYLIYDERSGCPFESFDAIQLVRLFWRPHFPYYKALNHLKIRFIRMVTA